jgi:hypothetical protein
MTSAGNPYGHASTGKAQPVAINETLSNRRARRIHIHAGCFSEKEPIPFLLPFG